MNAYIERVLAETKAKNANEPEFLQTVEEVLSSLEPVINAHPEYEKACLLECPVPRDGASGGEALRLDAHFLRQGRSSPLD